MPDKTPEIEAVNFSLEEICSNCRYANWHACERCYSPDNPRFCHCDINMEEQTDGVNGTCPAYTYEEPKKEEEEEEQPKEIVNTNKG